MLLDSLPGFCLKKVKNHLQITYTGKTHLAYIFGFICKRDIFSAFNSQFIFSIYPKNIFSYWLLCFVYYYKYIPFFSQGKKKKKRNYYFNHLKGITFNHLQYMQLTFFYPSEPLVEMFQTLDNTKTCKLGASVSLFLY